MLRDRQQWQRDHARHVVGVIAVGAGDDRWDE
jgi:hypothetical protein